MYVCMYGCMYVKRVRRIEEVVNQKNSRATAITLNPKRFQVRVVLGWVASESAARRPRPPWAVGALHTSETLNPKP